jgi:hypothetical protein
MRPTARLFFSKVSETLVLDALASHVPPEGRAVILADGYDPIGRAAEDPRVARIIDVRAVPTSELDRIEGADIVIYACTQDDLGLPFIEHLHRSGRRYYPVWGAKPGGYAFTSSIVRDVLESEYLHQQQVGFGKWDFGSADFENLIQALDLTKHLPGCYLEVGCYQGSSAGVVLRYLASTHRRMNTYFMDVFGGFSYEESARSADAIWHGTHVTEGEEAVRTRLLEYGVGHDGLRITIERRNIISDPLPAEIVAEGIAVANLDVDMHEAVAAGLQKLAPHIVPGGILVVEDAGHTPLLIGAKLALEQFLREPAGRQFMPLVMGSGQTFLIRR